jgi:serine/threonine-protein kinase
MLTHLDDDGEQRILLTDFGLARDINDVDDVTATTTAIGTVAYCAPEQLSGEEVGGRADKYALAATTYQLLTGEPLFPSSDPVEVITCASGTLGCRDGTDDHLNSKPPTLAAIRPELAALDPVLTVALSKRTESRFARCSHFARALTEQIAAMGPRSAVAPPNYGPPPVGDTFGNLYTEPLTVDPRAVAAKPKQFPVGSVVAAAVAAVAIAGLAAWLLWPSSDGSDPAATGASSTTASPANSEAQQRLRGVLPPGYSSSACTPAGVPQAAVAKFGCTQNSDAGGPPTSTSTLFEDDAALDSAFGAVVITREWSTVSGTSVTRPVAPQCHPAAGKSHAGLRFPRQRSDPEVEG